MDRKKDRITYPKFTNKLLPYIYSLEFQIKFNQRKINKGDKSQVKGFKRTNLITYKFAKKDED